MGPEAPSRRLALGLALILLASTLVVWAPAAFPASTGSPRSEARGAPVDSASSPPSATAPTPAPADGREPRILSELRSSRAPPDVVHPPDLSVPPPHPGELVRPTYSSAPAPMGISDLGLANRSGTLVPYTFTTSSVEGEVALTEAESESVDGDGPGSFGIQLDAVATNVTLFGNSTYQFWTQNFVSYTPSTDALAFGDNVWNFSNFAASISPNLFFAHGPNGTLDAPVLYYATGPTFTIPYPFAVTLYENSTARFDRPAIWFNYTLANATMRVSGSFDYVVFNSTTGEPMGPTAAGGFQISGAQWDPVGLPNDLELDVVGNDDGDTTSFYQMAATLSLATRNATTGDYSPVPTAWDAGSDSGETSDGLFVGFAGHRSVATMELGPAFVHGLWGMSSDAGATQIVQTLFPAATFLFVNPGTVANASTAQWVLGSPTGTTTFYLPNRGEYWVQYLLADRTPGGLLLDYPANASVALSFASTLDLSLGVYTPLIALGNVELPGLSSSGTGTAAHPFVLESNEYGPLDPEFAVWNDFEFPVFAGILLIGTSANVDVTPPPLSIDYPSWMQGGPAGVGALGLPESNSLQLQFWNASHVRLLDGRVTGWLSSSLFGSPEGSVRLWNTSDTLVDGVTFADQGDALALYGGSNNTIWGNTFFAAAVPASDPANVLDSGSALEAVNESESGDLLYNNYFEVPRPAIATEFEPLARQLHAGPDVYTDTWNVSPAPASAFRTVLGENLTGSIVGTAEQGGNFWSNYGSAGDPYGRLPYDNGGEIASGGDLDPLEPFSLYSVTFDAEGLPTGTSWGVTLAGIPSTSVDGSIEMTDPNGTFAYQVDNPAGFVATVGAGVVRVSGVPVSVSVAFVPARALTFLEAGLPAYATWAISLNGTTLGGTPVNSSAGTSGSVIFSVAPGFFFFNASAPGFLASPTPGTVDVAQSPTTVVILFRASPALTFSESGLAGNTTWTVALTQANSTIALTSGNSSVVFGSGIAVPGAYRFSASAPGYFADPAQGSGTLPGNGTQRVVFSLATGFLAVTVDPMGALLWIDGDEEPRSPNGTFDVSLAVGLYSVAAIKSGFEPYFNNVSVTKAGTTNLAISLVLVPIVAPTCAGAVVGPGVLLAIFGVAVGLLLATRKRAPPRGALHDPTSPPRPTGTTSPDRIEPPPPAPPDGSGRPEGPTRERPPEEPGPSTTLEQSNGGAVDPELPGRNSVAESLAAERPARG